MKFFSTCERKKCSKNSLKYCGWLKSSYVIYEWHLSETGLPFSWRVHKCHACGKYPVPDVMFTTIEPPIGKFFSN